MKIAILTSGGVDRGGEERVIPCLLWLIERLVQAGDEVHVFSLYQEPEPGTWPLRGATVHNAGSRQPARQMFRQLLAEHRRAPFQVIHASWSLIANLVGVMAGKVLGVPSLVYLGNTELAEIPDIPTPQASLQQRALLRLAVMTADRVATQSAPMVRQAERKGISAIRLPFGVALDRWPAAPPRFRAPNRPARLLHVGSIIPVKDHAMLLEAAASLRARGVDFEIDVIGEDVAGDGVVRLQAEAQGLAGRVRFHGFLPHNAMRPYFERADLHLVTSRHEAGPLVALEAAVAGVPTVGTSVGHLEEWSPLAARVVAPRDSAALCQAIVELLSDDGARLALAARAQERALAEDADVASRRFREVYAEMSDGLRRTPHSPSRLNPGGLPEHSLGSSSR